MRRGYIDGKEVKYGIDWAKPENEQDSQRKSRIRSAIEWLRSRREIVLGSSSMDILKELSGLPCDGCAFYPSMCQLCYAVSQHDDIVRRDREGRVK